MFRFKHQGLVQISPGHYDDWARFVRKLAAGSSVRGPINRTKRLYLETVACGVVRVEHRSIKNELAERSSVRCDCTVLICLGVKES
jgi:mannose/cellobiose epimerase-like protein (N-acyl-D-glucosamine 2-epimerase family)